MRFAHLADVHLGAWRDPAMKGLGLEAFRRAIKTCIEKKVDFVIIAGDLFNTAMPAIDHLQEAVILLKKLRKELIPVYVVPGSHDYNAGGKTMLDVLEEAELLTNVMKGNVISGRLKLNFTIDPKTGAKLTGIGGRKGGLESNDYKQLDLASLEKEPGFKIFIFHTSITELKPDEMYMMDSMSIREFPKGFDYYAGGHVHIVSQLELDSHKNIVYPGPLFPASFSELWKLGRGGFYLFEDGKTIFQPIELKKVQRLEFSGEKKSAAALSKELIGGLEKKDFTDSIVLIRASGELSEGKPADVDFKSLFRELYNRRPFFIMRNTTQLTSKELVNVAVRSGDSDVLENEIIREQAKESELFKPKTLQVIKELIHSWSAPQNDGEKKYEYEERMKKDGDKIIG